MPNYMEKFRLDNKTAIVVGGLGLIGSETTTALSSAGAKVIVLDCKEKNRKNNTIWEFLDVADTKNLDSRLVLLLKKYGPVNILVNCAYPRTDDWETNNFTHVTLESLQENVDIHMNSSIWIARTIANHMVDHKEGGSIINMASIYGILGQDLTIYKGTDMRENMTYAAIKGAIVNFTRQMASYYGQYNIRVNTLCPGGLFDNQDDNFVNNYSRKTPLKRMAHPEEIASVTLFLASGAASYVTGATIMVDGGYSIV